MGSTRLRRAAFVSSSPWWHIAYNRNTQWLLAHKSTDGTDNPGEPRLISHSMVRSQDAAILVAWGGWPLVDRDGLAAGHRTRPKSSLLEFTLPDKALICPLFLCSMTQPPGHR